MEDKKYVTAETLQRKFLIGYTKAAKLLEKMESEKLVGPLEAPKGRKLLVQLDEVFKYAQKQIIEENEGKK